MDGDGDAPDRIRLERVRSGARTVAGLTVLSLLLVAALLAPAAGVAADNPAVTGTVADGPGTLAAAAGSDARAAGAEHPRRCRGFHRRTFSGHNKRKVRKKRRRARRRHRRCHRRLIRAERRANRVGRDYFGSSGSFLFNRDVDPDPLLESIHRAGIREVRHGPLWHVIEKTPPVLGVHNYDWSSLDRKMVLLAQHHLRLHELLAYGARWASPHPLDPQAWKYAPKPSYFDEWAEWAAASARRYGRGGSFWKEHPELPYLPVRSYEIWNETNYSSYAFVDKPEQYADLYLQARERIKAVDPQAEVIFTIHGFEGVDSWLARAVEAEPTLASVVDSAAVFLYGSSVEQSLHRLAGFRDALDDNLGAGVDLEVTEDGMAQWPEHDDVRARYLRTMALTVPRSGCDVTRYLLYTWWTPEQNRYDPEDWYGVADSDGTLKGSGEAYVEAIHRMEGKGKKPVPAGEVPVCG